MTAPNPNSPFSSLAESWRDSYGESPSQRAPIADTIRDFINRLILTNDIKLERKSKPVILGPIVGQGSGAIVFQLKSLAELNTATHLVARVALDDLTSEQRRDVYNTYLSLVDHGIGSRVHDMLMDSHDTIVGIVMDYVQGAVIGSQQKPPASTDILSRIDQVVALAANDPGLEIGALKLMVGIDGSVYVIDPGPQSQMDLLLRTGRSYEYKAAAMRRYAAVFKAYLLEASPNAPIPHEGGGP